MYIPLKRMDSGYWSKMIENTQLELVLIAHETLCDHMDAFRPRVEAILNTAAIDEYGVTSA